MNPTSMDDIKGEAVTTGLHAAALLIANHRLWNDAVMWCGDLMDKDMTKEAKHAKVHADLQFIIDDSKGDIKILGPAILDILIKLAVLYISAQK